MLNGGGLVDALDDDVRRGERGIHVAFSHGDVVHDVVGLVCVDER